LREYDVCVCVCVGGWVCVCACVCVCVCVSSNIITSNYHTKAQLHKS